MEKRLPANIELALEEYRKSVAAFNEARAKCDQASAESNQAFDNKSSLLVKCRNALSEMAKDNNLGRGDYVLGGVYFEVYGDGMVSDFTIVEEPEIKN